MRPARFLFALTAASGLASRADACSTLVRYGPAISPRAAFFLGHATGDTVVAGPGSVHPVTADGHSGDAGTGAVYGQVFTVDRAGGAAPASATRAVLVPWDYAANCAPVQWSSGWRWQEPNIGGLYQAFLRDSTEWAAGIPTYDVHFVPAEPYRGGGARWMTPDSLFAFMQLMPVTDAATVPRDSFARLFAWARARPNAKSLQPAAESMTDAIYSSRADAVARIVSPFLGTYAVTVTIGRDVSRSFVIRTYSELMEDWSPHPPPATLDWLQIQPIEGYTMMVGPAQRDSVPILGSWTMRGTAFVDVTLRPERANDSTSVWVGDMETELVRRQFPGDSAVLRHIPADSYIPATFTIGPGGAARIEGRLTLPGGIVVSVVAARVSLVTYR
jgi:hypothetical protein